MIFILTALFAAYILCIVILSFGVGELSVFSSEIATNKTRFSIVIPFRNEANNLPQLLKSIEEIKYPSSHFEVILVNDESCDNSAEIVTAIISKSKFSIRLLQNKRISNSPKKDAITEAIKHAKHEWIVTTDADCNLPKTWLQTYNTFIAHHSPKMICGPVLYNTNGNFLQNFQQLDGLSLQAVTMGSLGFKRPLLCNGANLAYTKSAFNQVKGFSGNNHIASGDDIFLLDKIKTAFPNRVMFLKSKEAIVTTQPQHSFKAIINQRVRWASKTSKQKNIAAQLLGVLVFLISILIVLFPLVLLFDPHNFEYYLILLSLKITADYLLIYHSAKFFGVRVSAISFIFRTFLYAAIVVTVVFRSLKGGYSWRGRSFN